MSPRSLADGGSLSLRAVSSMITFWAATGLVMLFVVDAAVRGRWELALRAAGVGLLIVWCAWVFLIRMSVRLDAAALTTNNLLRWVRVPWGRVVDVERRAQLVVLTDDGTAITCWGSPFAPRGGARGTGRGPAGTTTAISNPYGRSAGDVAGTGGAPTGDGALQAVRMAWSEGHKTDEAVTRGWDVPALVAGAACLVLAVIALLA
ncbi:PH domain-containing protein [Microbacterium sp.]|uniref:PH domain-containing protein n=1 Tax=Microbacterium sp. TaxID=51671 RepID=UPI003A95DE20